MAGYSIGLIGATGVVGSEILAVLDERRFPVSDLLAFAGADSEGDTVELLGEEYVVEPLDAVRAARCDVLFVAAPVFADLRGALEGASARVIDLSGGLELDPAVALYLPGLRARRPPAGEPCWVAIPRGVVSGLALALGALIPEAEIESVCVTTLESAGGVGRRGPDELSEQTIELLNAMTGEAEDLSGAFPRPLAFDCLPQVGDLLDDGDTSEERRLRHVLRRLLDRPKLPIDVTRVRVPTFTGSLAAVHVDLAKDVSPARAVELFDRMEGLQPLEDAGLPTPRSAVAAGLVLVGRVRRGDAPQEHLAFALAQDDLRQGSALHAVLAAEALVAS